MPKLVVNHMRRDVNSTGEALLNGLRDMKQALQNSLEQKITETEQILAEASVEPKVRGLGLRKA